MSTSNSGYLSPDEITNKAFDSKRRGGFDPEAVKRHLASAAATVHGLGAERDALLDQVARLQEQLQNAAAHPVPQAELDEDALTERLGQDAARVLAEARSAAADRIAEAESQADDIRAAAEEVYAERSVLADAEADKIRANAEQLRAEQLEEAERAAAQIIARAESDAEALRAGVAGERQSADADASRIVREAELTRRQILEDLARRRSAARRQIEQLRAGRERLLASHETVRRALDDISQELTISMSEARAAAETAGHSVSDTTIEELEAEIETARLTGLLDTGPVPVVSTPKRPSTAGSARPYTEDDSDGDTAVDDATTDAATPDETAGSDEPTADDAPAEDAATAEVGEVTGPALAQDIGRSAEADDSEDSAGGTSSSSGAGLADVVQLDLARNDVDTATHPATGRDASSGRGSTATPEETPGEAAVAEASDSTPPVLEAVDSHDAAEPDEATEPEATTEPEPETDGIVDEKIDDLIDDEDAVGDLFASLRSTPPPAPKKPRSAAKKSSTKSTAKKSTAKKSAAKKTSPKSSAQSEQVDVDSTDVTRRLKRVLADEQSRAMSQIKSATEMPSLDELLGAPAAHIEGYWVEIVAQLDDVVSDDEQLRRPVDELVESIRRRVDDALTEAGDDSEGAVSSLRSVYRELKTQRVAVCADEVCRMAAGRSADRS